MTISDQFNQVLREWTEVFMRRSMHDFKRFMDENGLSPSQVNALMQLHHCGDCGISDIGANLGETSAAGRDDTRASLQRQNTRRARAPAVPTLTRSPGGAAPGRPGPATLGWICPRSPPGPGPTGSLSGSL